ncbi:MAG: hypothetical protein HY053_05285 [Proteobacteria bacterium]|nr:hypothetical protein [Pseudomonadota bacterium]
MAKNVKRTVDVDPIWKRFSGFPQGRFEALVRLSSEDYSPDYMKILGPFTPGVMKAEIRTEALQRLAADEHVLSVELREYVVV